MNRITKLRRDFGSQLALSACLELDDIDRATGLAKVYGWEPLEFDPRMAPPIEMVKIRV